MNHFDATRCVVRHFSLATLLIPLFAFSGESVAPSPDNDPLRTADEARKWIRSQSAAAPEAAGPLDAKSQLGEKASLEMVLKLTLQNNPMISAASHRWQASTYKRPQDTSLPDPRLEATYFIKQNFDRYMLTLSQDIPYPGKLIIAGKVADKAALASYLRYQAAIRNAIADAKDAYFELYYIDHAQAITGEVKTLYERYAALGAGGSEVAKPKLPETFKAESQRAQLGYDLVLLKEMRVAQTEKLRAVMGLEQRHEIGAIEEIAEPIPLTDDIEKLTEIANAHNQELAAAGVEVEKSDYQLKLAKRAPIPNLMIGGTYWTETNPKETNPLGVMVGVTIPIWWGKYHAMKKEAEEMGQAARADQTAMRLQTRSDLATAYFKLKNSERLVQLYRDTLLPQARQAMQSAEALYRKGDASLTSLLETTSTVHNFELARLRATVDFYQNVARMERILGTALQIKPAAPTPNASQIQQGGKP